MYGWVYARNIEKIPNCEGTLRQWNNSYLFKNLLAKFPEDIVDMQEEDVHCFFDGYIFDKDKLCKTYEEPTWTNVFAKNCRHNIVENDYRGGFSGFVNKEQEQETIGFVDQMGVRTAFYYVSSNQLIISSNINFIVDILNKEKISIHLDETAARYMLSFGSMIDDSTMVKEIKRILPGCKVIFRDGRVIKEQYYRMDNTKRKQDMSEKDAMQLIDDKFRNAIRREFEKDKEYGYRHLVDLSGGLDSRMVCFVAHDMGYTDQVNFTYSRSKYLDFKISEKIAKDLKHDYLFQPLDTCNWMHEIDENVEKGYGLIRYNSLTGGNLFLKTINPDMFGMEHTGMVGDVIISSFYKDEKTAMSMPQFGRHLYAEKMIYDFDDNILKQYRNQELFALYTRGLLNAQGSYFIRQNYFEPTSPFLDVDVVDACLSLPFDYRKKHYIYLKWINDYYPQASEYGWEKWGGVKPKQSHIKYRRFVTAKRLLNIWGCRIFKKACTDSMNPMDYWYNSDASLQNFYDSYFDKYICSSHIPQEMRKELEELYREGTACEKGMVLTVLGAVAKFFERG